MRRLFVLSVVVALSIVGSVIGAGFITGKEIYEFFAKDFSLSSLYLTFVCFTLLTYFIMNLDGQSKRVRALEIFVAIANIIISACMISALKNIYLKMLSFSEKVEILTILSAIFIFIISCFGILAIQKFSAILTPIIIGVIVVFSFLKIEDFSISLSPSSSIGIYNPAIYVGFNSVLSLGVIKNSGKGLSPLFKMFASILTSLILCCCIYLICCTLKVSFIDDMPFVNAFSYNKKLSIIIDIITLFSVFTTLASSFYTAIDFGGIKISVATKAIIFLICLSISNVGFSVIVERVYPLIGVLGYAFIGVIYLLSKSSQSKQRSRTLAQPRCRE